MDVKRWTCSVTNAFPVFWGSMFIPNQSLGRLLYFLITACSLLFFIRRLLSVFNSQ